MFMYTRLDHFLTESSKCRLEKDGYPFWSLWDSVSTW